ncbi:unnamed protein product [Brachyspira suanatina]|uniref:Zinc ribbon domain-containing protein n=1 Tax=Brachyspira suanatina TaxID=381802 RepID=A0A0G4K905_9SPIR|nr:zinc ribbon domain-containing protein [Brachyspira suanatina]CRF34130.1 unnamed protein product [Brachyspira suanatina]
MMPFNPPFIYKCNSCGKIFYSRKRPSVIHLFGFSPKCPKCGSKDTKSMDHIIKK